MKKLMMLVLGCVSFCAFAYRPFECHVQFYPGGGSGSMASQVWTIDTDSDAYWMYGGVPCALPACKFTRSGYTFAGWKVYDACVYGPDSPYNGGYTGLYPAGATYYVCGWLYLEATWKQNGGGVVSSSWQKSRVLRGAFGEGCGDVPSGICELKCGKANRRGYAKVALKVTKADGKKVNYGSAQVYVGNGGAVTANLKNRYTVTIQSNGSFSGEPIYSGARPACSPNSVWSASVGGVLSGRHYLGLQDWDGMELAILKAMGMWAKYQGGFCSYFMDAEEMPFTASGRNWLFPASAYLRVPKVVYTERTGLFKGSLKVAFGPYCMEPEPGQRPPREKKISVKLRGAYVGGCICGTAVYRTISSAIYGE